MNLPLEVVYAPDPLAAFATYEAEVAQAYQVTLAEVEREYSESLLRDALGKRRSNCLGSVGLPELSRQLPPRCLR